jgi:exodeoxyribonuclease V alpha subunit
MNAIGKSTFGQFAQDDPCIWTVNDYDRRLWNGSLGRIVQIGVNSMTAEFDGVTQEIDRTELDRIELAYCISVHKAQGSQFANVIMPVTQSFNFDRTMLYTGLTRAVSRVVLVGSQAVLVRAIKEPPRSLDRDVALSLGESSPERQRISQKG